MAIFSNVHDAGHVSMLTQLAQVDRTNQEELLWFASMFHMGKSEEAIKATAETCEVVYNTLYGLATQKAVPAACLLWLNKNAVKTNYIFRTVEPIPGSANTEYFAQHGMQPIDLTSLELRADENGEPGPIYLQAFVYQRLTRHIQIAIELARENKPLPFALCKECKNPFVAHSSQVYCSHRCANRAGTRRRREQEKLSPESYVA